VFFFAAALLDEDRPGAELLLDHGIGRNISSPQTSVTKHVVFQPEKLMMRRHDMKGSFIREMSTSQHVRTPSKTRSDIFTGTHPVSTTTLTPETP
jgi:hypothetical protein